jgi:hypothetical protein
MEEPGSSNSYLTRKVTADEAAMSQAGVDLKHLSQRDKDMQIRKTADIILESPERLAKAIENYVKNETTLNRLSI